MERSEMRQVPRTTRYFYPPCACIKQEHTGVGEVDIVAPTKMSWRIVLGISLSLAACLPSTGCQSAMLTAYYLIHGMDDDADFAGLKDKKVVVVSRPLGTLHYSNSNVTREISQQVSELLKTNIKKITVVDQRKVAKWVDENRWDEFVEVGKAMKADLVIGVDLEGFGLFEGQTLYRGRANVAVHVFDCKTGKEVFTRVMPPSIYPPNTGVPTQDKQEGEFRREFEQILAERIAQHFYAHDPHADVALDVAAFRK
jgi:hypothetical protein